MFLSEENLDPDFYPEHAITEIQTHEQFYPYKATMRIKQKMKIKAPETVKLPFLSYHKGKK